MTRTPSFLLTLTLAALPALGCGGTGGGAAATRDSAVAFDLSAMRAEIEARNRIFTEAHVVIDSAAMVNIFTTDARILPPNADPVIGRPAIEAMTAQYMTFGITEFREETSAFYGNEELLVDEGTYVMTYDKGRSTEKGKYVNVWRKEGGEWKIYSNMWNTNAPTAAGK